MILTLRGTPFLYYGEELGMADGPIPADRVVDVAGRDPERTPMQWDASPGAGFTTGEPWLPINPEAEAINAASQRADETSLLALHRELISIRRGSAALRRGSYRSVDIAPDDVFAYVREAGDERWLVALNFSDQMVSLRMPGLRGRLRLSTDPADLAPTRPMYDQVAIPAEAGLLIRLEPGSA